MFAGLLALLFGGPLAQSAQAYYNLYDAYTGEYLGVVDDGVPSYEGYLYLYSDGSTAPSPYNYDGNTKKTRH